MRRTRFTFWATFWWKSHFWSFIKILRSFQIQLKLNRNSNQFHIDWRFSEVLLFIIISTFLSEIKIYSCWGADFIDFRWISMNFTLPAIHRRDSFLKLRFWDLMSLNCNWTLSEQFRIDWHIWCLILQVWMLRHFCEFRWNTWFLWISKDLGADGRIRVPQAVTRLTVTACVELRPAN